MDKEVYIRGDNPNPHFTLFYGGGNRSIRLFGKTQDVYLEKIVRIYHRPLIINNLN